MILQKLISIIYTLYIIYWINADYNTVSNFFGLNVEGIKNSRSDDQHKKIYYNYYWLLFTISCVANNVEDDKNQMFKA